MTDPSIITREVDARFAAQAVQTGKPVHKLDPHDPQDAKSIQIWRDIETKVKAEDAAGNLVLTYGLPDVIHKIGEAFAAGQQAVAHIDAAQAASDPWDSQQHVDAAAAALEHSAQKASEAAAHQPPTISPQLMKEAAQQAAASPPPPHAPGHQQVAHAQALAAHKPVPRGILEKETDARWSAQYHIKPGQLLDPKDPHDAKLIPLWLDVYRKVKKEADSGRLVLTYNNPHVAQPLAEAHAADKVAAAHYDASITHPDPEAARQHAAYAAHAAEFSRHKAHEAARLQPPVVSQPIAHEVARRAGDHDLLMQESYARLWSTGYKPGHTLDPKDPQDARMIPFLERIHQQVAHEHEAAQPHRTGREHLARMQAQDVEHHAAQVHHAHRRHARHVRSTVPQGRIKDYRTQAAAFARQANAPFVLAFLHPDGTPDRQVFASRKELDAAYAALSEHHDQYKYAAAFDLAATPNAPIYDSVGISAAEHVETPAAGEAPGEGAPSGGAPEAEPEEKPKWGVGKIVAIAAAVAAAGGLVYAVTRKKKPGSPGAGSSSKVIVATPSRVVPTRVVAPLPRP